MLTPLCTWEHITLASRLSLRESKSSTATCDFHSLGVIGVWPEDRLQDPDPEFEADTKPGAGRVRERRNWCRRSHKECTKEAEDLTFNWTWYAALMIYGERNSDFTEARKIIQIKYLFEWFARSLRIRVVFVWWDLIRIMTFVIINSFQRTKTPK